MIDLHYWTSPNGHKITMFLEETGLPYWLVPSPATERVYSIAKQLNPQAPMPVRRAERRASRRTG
jgi:glutathione S-transferase